MDKVKIASELVKVAKAMLSSFPYGMFSSQTKNWEQFASWIKKRYRKASVKLEEVSPKYGSIYTFSVIINGNRVAELRVVPRYEDDFESRFTVWSPDSNSDYIRKDDVMDFNTMRNFWQKSISDETDEKWRTGGNVLSEKAADKLQTAVDNAVSDVKQLLSGVKIERYEGHGTDFRTTGRISLVAKTLDKDIMEVWWNVNRAELRTLKGRKGYSGLQSLIKDLRRIKTIYKRELKDMDKFEVATLLGKPISPIRKVGKPKVRYSRLDEWYDTTVIVPVTLRTSNDVPELAIKEWLRKNMDEITSRIPEPKNVNYPSPRSFRYENIELFDFDQTGNKGIIEIMISDR